MSLPSGYKQLEYIQSSGTQYIDTGFKPNQNTKFEVDLAITNTSCHVFGARTSYLNKAFVLFWASNSGFCIQMANSKFNGGAFDTTKRYKVTMTSSQLFLDDSLQVSYSVGDFQCEQNAWLMSCYSSSASEYAKGKLYSAKIYDGNTLVRDFISCKNPDGVIGMWDDVNSVFYGNAGTGNFTAGAEVKGSHKTLIDGTAYVVKGGRELIAGTGYAKKQGKTLIDGTLFTVPFSKGIPLNTITPGAILYLNESGSPVPFYIAKHDYESGLNGAGRTLLVRRDCYDMRPFASPEADFPQNNYANSRLDSWLRGTYTNFLDIDTRALIGTTKFYYTPGYGGSVTTLQRTVFQLSLTELGKSEWGKKPEGSALPIASKLQIAYRNGRAVYQWTRSPDTTLSDTVYCLDIEGTLMGDAYDRSYGSRPAFTLPETLGLVQNPDGTYIIAE